MEEKSWHKDLIENYKNTLIALKVRKIELFKSIELPIANIEIFDFTQIAFLQRRIKFKIEMNPQIVRFACVPDRLGVSSIYINTSRETSKVFSRILDTLRQYPEIKNIILQNATKKTTALNKISGRLLLENENLDSSRKRVLELYKGSRDTGILNRVNADDKNFIIFEKRYGEFMKPTMLNQNSTITNLEICQVWKYLQEYETKIKLIQNIILTARGNAHKYKPLIFEFSLNVGKFLFIDID